MNYVYEQSAVNKRMGKNKLNRKQFYLSNWADTRDDERY